MWVKESTLERADFTHQPLIFEIAEEERVMLIILFYFRFSSAAALEILSKDESSTYRP